MPKRKKPEMAPAEQRKLFEKAAKEAGVTNKEEEFERAFGVVAKQKPKPVTKSSPSK